MNRKNRKMLITVMVAMLIISMSSCAGCAGCNKNDTPVNTTPTAAVTATTVPTATVEPTKEVEPTIAPTPTDIPATPTPLPTPEPTATLIPTNTPEPTKAVSENAKLLDSVKMGDNVWYDFYDDGTLVVRGTGVTRDVKAEFSAHYDGVSLRYNDTEYDNITSDNVFYAKNIIIEEGITELGDWSLSGFPFATKITFPATLKTIGYAALFVTVDENVEIYGLRTDMFFGEYALGSTYKNVTSEFEKFTVAPTPLPRPTATPVPNPDKPRNYATKKMGDNVTFEFWDNGYLYIKGTGATWDKDWTFLELENDPYNKTHTVIVEEGITYLGDFVLQGLKNVKFFEFPRTLTSIGNTWGSGENAVISGYYNGKAITIKTQYASNPYGGPKSYFRILGDIDAAIADGYEITFE